MLGGTEAATGSWIEVRSPFSGELLARVAKAGPREIERALEAAVSGFEEARRLPGHRRADCLRAVRQALEGRRAEVVATIVAEAGKPVRFAEAEFERGLITLRLASEEATRIEGEVLPVDIEARGEGAFCAVRRFPIGPVTAITPFNFPFNLVLHKVAPAMAAGCSVILKPSPRTPLTAHAVARAIGESGWPAKAFSLLHADPDTARPLWTDARVRCVSFTGSDAVGWKIKEEASKKKVTLELGGNAAAIVCADADVEDAARKLAVAAFAYAGQVCIKAQRLFVERPVRQQFLTAFLAASRAIEPADPRDQATVLGPMIDEESARRVAAWVAEARDAGARLLLEGRREGNRLWPTLADRVPEGAKIRDREVFGPVATFEEFDAFEDAVARVNASPYGLQASVFTRDIGKALRSFEGLEVGAVIVNDTPSVRIDNFPYGGVKASGFGREGVRYAIEEMTEPRVLFLRS